MHSSKMNHNHPYLGGLPSHAAPLGGGGEPSTAPSQGLLNPQPSQGSGLRSQPRGFAAFQRELTALSSQPPSSQGSGSLASRLKRETPVFSQKAVACNDKIVAEFKKFLDAYSIAKIDKLKDTLVQANMLLDHIRFLSLELNGGDPPVAETTVILRD